MEGVKWADSMDDGAIPVKNMEPSIVERTKEDKEPVHEVVPGVKNFGYTDPTISIGTIVRIDNKIGQVKDYDKQKLTMTITYEG